MTGLFTGETLLAALRRRRAKRVLVVGDPLGRHLGELAAGGIDLVSATEDPFTLDLHSAFLVAIEDPLPEPVLAALAKAEPPAQGEATAAAAVLAGLPPGSPHRGLALATLVLAMSSQPSTPTVPWADLVAKFSKWVGQNYGVLRGQHEVWSYSPGEVLLSGTFQAMVLMLAPSAAEDELRAQASRLGYADAPAQPLLLAALNKSWQAPGALLPAVFAVTTEGQEKSLPKSFSAFAGLCARPCDLFGRPACFWTP